MKATLVLVRARFSPCCGGLVWLAGGHWFCGDCKQVIRRDERP